jgi:hypothetical protein
VYGEFGLAAAVAVQHRALVPEALHQKQPLMQPSATKAVGVCCTIKCGALFGGVVLLVAELWCVGVFVFLTVQHWGALYRLKGVGRNAVQS